MTEPSDSTPGNDTEAGEPAADLVPATVGSEPGRSDDHSGVATVLAEILPGIALVFGCVPAELELDLVDLGFVTSADRAQLSTALSVIGNTATVTGSVGNALAGVQGLYRVSEATKAMLDTGAKLAVKDGANLGTMITSKGFAQARFISVTGLSGTNRGRDRPSNCHDRTSDATE